VLVEDKNGTLYRSYYDKQPLWQTEGQPYLGAIGCTLWGAVGESTTPGGYLRFFVRKFIAMPQSQQAEVPFDATEEVTRSPLDVFTAKGLDVTPLDQQPKIRKGDCSFTISMPSEEERILVNSLCEKAKSKGLVKAKGHYPGQFLKAWLIEQAIKDGLLGV
jgi:hypothetical protein